MKDCRDCIYANILTGELDGWVKCDKYCEGVSFPHSPCFAEIMCNVYKSKHNIKHV